MYVWPHNRLPSYFAYILSNIKAVHLTFFNPFFTTIISQSISFCYCVKVIFFWNKKCVFRIFGPKCRFLKICCQKCRFLKTKKAFQKKYKSRKAGPRRPAGGGTPGISFSFLVGLVLRDWGRLKGGVFGYC